MYGYMAGRALPGGFSMMICLLFCQLLHFWSPISASYVLNSAGSLEQQVSQAEFRTSFAAAAATALLGTGLQLENN